MCIDPLSIPVWQNTSAPSLPPRDFTCSSFFPEASTRPAQALHVPHPDSSSATSDSSLAVAVQRSSYHEPSRPPLCPPSRGYATSTSQLHDMAAPYPDARDRDCPRPFPLLTPPSETPVEAARSLLESTPVDPLGFGETARAGALFAPDMTPPPGSALTGVHAAPTPTVASANTEAMYTPSADTPATGEASAVTTQGPAGGLAAGARNGGRAHARSLSGMLRACVVDTFGFGSTATVGSTSVLLPCWVSYAAAAGCRPPLN